MACVQNSNREGPPVEEVILENKGCYVFKKIYIEDKLGRTHEILTASSGNAEGGVCLIELCVYGGTEEIDRNPEER